MTEIYITGKNQQQEQILIHNTELKGKRQNLRLLQLGLFFAGMILIIGGQSLFFWLFGVQNNSPLFVSGEKNNLSKEPANYSITKGPSLTLEKELFEISKKISQENNILKEPAIYNITEGPRLTMEEELFDFGKISQEEQVEHIFSFSNTGNSTLTIDNIETS